MMRRVWLAMATLSLAMIVKNERRTLGRVLEFAKTICDELVVVDTGSSDGTQDIVRAAGAKLFHFEWSDDFAAARNFAFAQCTQEWILWLDADDMLSAKSLEAVRALKQNELNDLRYEAVFTPYHYEYLPSGEVSVVLNRERFLRRNVGHRWVGRIHEVIPSAWTRSTNTKAVVVEHRPHREDLPRKVGRNLRNYEAWIDLQRSELRDLFLYGSELLWNGRSKDAIPVLETYLARFRGSDVIGERYMVFIKLADSLMVQNRRDDATSRCLQAIQANPTRAEGYCLLGLNYAHLGQYENAWPMFVAAASCGVPNIQSGLVVHKFYSETPRVELARCMEHLKQPQRVRVLAELAQTLIAPLLTQQQQQQQQAAPTVPPPGVAPPPAPVPPPLPRVVPDPIQGAQDAPVVRIHAGSAGVAFSPESLQQGSATAPEWAVAELAKAWVKLGAKVVVYGQTQGDWDGVLYRSHTAFDASHPSDVLVLWRSLEAVAAGRPLARQVIAWPQAVDGTPAFTPELLDRVDRVAVQSRHQLGALQASHPAWASKIWHVGTAIDAGRYEARLEKVPHRYYYAGAPQHGLALLLDSWLKVRQMLPDAELHVSSDFQTALQTARARGPAAMTEVEDLLRRVKGAGGVVLHDNLNVDLLAAIQKTCVGWLVPPSSAAEDVTTAAALEAQAAACVPVSRLNGALPEAFRHVVPWDASADLADLLIRVVPAFGQERLADNRVWALGQSWTAHAQVWLQALVKPRVAA